MIANCVENIPFEDDQPSPHMPVPRREMNVRLSELCNRYDLDYWVWTPVVFDLKDQAKRAAEIERHVSLYQACPRLDAVFVPGGDPGANPPELLLPFLQDIGAQLMARHPAARVWLSLQWFNRAQIEEVYAYLDKNQPGWLGGLVAGPSSPPILETRKRLSTRYKLRHYPDIPHTQLKRLEEIRTWEDPGPGSFYDNVGHVAKSPHVVRGKTGGTRDEDPEPTHWWWDEGYSRRRLSRQISMDWPIAVRYEHLDPNAAYVIRSTGNGEALTRINGQRVTSTLYGKGIGEIKEFPIPPEMDGIDFLEQLKSGKRVYGTSIVSSCPLWPPAVKKAGADFVIIDTEHKPLDRMTVAQMTQFEDSAERLIMD